jgi:hypothetical protein
VLQDNSICNNINSKVLINQAFDEFNPFLGNNFIDRLKQKWSIRGLDGCIVAGFCGARHLALWLFQSGDSSAIGLVVSDHNPNYLL